MTKIKVPTGFVRLGKIDYGVNQRLLVEIYNSGKSKDKSNNATIDRLLFSAAMTTSDALKMSFLFKEEIAKALVDSIKSIKSTDMDDTIYTCPFDS